jgi:hypothetical protein
MKDDHAAYLTYLTAESYPRAAESNPVDSERKVLIAPAPDVQARKIANASAESEKQIILEPIYPDPYVLSYTCLLIPKFGSHYLMGDLADNLQIWMKQICISFGWKLDFLMTKPAYLEWAMQIAPSTSPAYCIQTVRQQVSAHIIEEHPRFSRENVSNDFWAPGHIIIVGSRPLPEDLIERFIQTTRQQQGY